MIHFTLIFFFFFLNNPATPEFSPFSLHHPLPSSPSRPWSRSGRKCLFAAASAPPMTSSTSVATRFRWPRSSRRSEEHTSELQSRQYLVCRLLLEKKERVHD